MLDIKFVRENPEIVKQNIRNKFQDNKLELVDKVIELDKENREIKQEVEALRAERNKTSKQIGALMAQGKRDEAEEVKKQVAASGARIDELSAREKEVEEELLKNMMVIPNIIDPSVPIGKDDSENVEIEKLSDVPIIILGGSPHIVAEPPRLAQNISDKIIGTGLNFSSLASSIDTAARNNITVILSINIASPKDIIINVINNALVR